MTVIQMGFGGLRGNPPDAVGMPIDPAQVAILSAELSLTSGDAHELLDLLDRLLGSKFLGNDDVAMSSIEGSSCGLRFRRRSDGSATMNALRIQGAVELWSSVDLHYLRERLADALVERDRLEGRAPSVELAPR
ncbi:MAG: hypothetical protein HZA53_18745 [Planctomycetes bacterium]|nr:hypothetical protein [Planctomycetota bacterium]